ncbi:MAG: GGDEF domain-containing protein [Ruminococcus sp.]|nr:GGDEF domain-containing protein [Ruminococcus sp.]
MANKSKDENKLQGYDPAQFRRMTAIFVVLSLLNIGAVQLAFMRSGYGLYHAESALSHIAQVQQNVQTVSEKSLDMLVHKEEDVTAKRDMININEAFEKIETESKGYTDINLESIDPKLRESFSDAESKIEAYKKALEDFNDEFAEKMEVSGEELDAYLNTIETKYSNNIEPLKDAAEEAVNKTFDAQNKATYDFFVRCAQQFLFVLIFLLVTLTIGIIGIKKMKKNAKVAAEAIRAEHLKAEKSREKSISIAYTNIVTSFRNRYGLEMDLDAKVKVEDISIALFKILSYDNVSERYGRSTADEYVLTISKALKKTFGDVADIYSTDNDEFCFVFKDVLDENGETDVILPIARTISHKVELDSASLQCLAAGCYYNCVPGTHSSCNTLLLKMDKAMSIAKQKTLSNGQNVVINVNNL